MRNPNIRKMMLLILSVCFLSVYFGILLWRTNREENLFDSLQVQYEIDGNQISQKLWWDETDENYYLFLPSGLKEVTSCKVVYQSAGADLYINEDLYLSGSNWKIDPETSDTEHKIQFRFGNESITRRFVILSGENIASMFIESKKIDRLYEKMDENISAEEPLVLLFDEKGETIYQNRAEKIKLHGNLTRRLDKKPYNLYLKNAESLLGLKAGKKWVLLANATDGTYFRNKAMLDLANACADEKQYEACGEFVELYINGDYQGIYLLTEAIESSEYRMDVSLEDNWFLEKTLAERVTPEANYVKTLWDNHFEVKNTPKLSEEESKEILKVLEEVESALRSEVGISENGQTIEELIDFKSFALNFLLREISGDHDTGLSSDYFYFAKEGNHKIYAGPLWDFDGIWGNVNKQQYRIPNALLTSVEYALPEQNPNQNRWFAALYKKEKFQNIVKELYREKVYEQVHKLYDENIGEYVVQLEKSVSRDSLRWNTNQAFWYFAYPENYHISEEGTYKRFNQTQSHIEMVKNFLRQKIEFLDALYIEEREFCKVTVLNEAPYLNQDWPQTRYFWIEKNEPIGDLTWTNQDGFYFDTFRVISSGEIVKPEMLVETDLVIETIIEEKGDN